MPKLNKIPFPYGTFTLAVKIYLEKYMEHERLPADKITPKLLNTRYYNSDHTNSLKAVNEVIVILEAEKVDAMQKRQSVFKKYGYTNE